MQQPTTDQPQAPATLAPLVLVLAGTRNDHRTTTWAAQEAARRCRPLVVTSLLEERSWSEPGRATAGRVAEAAALRARRQEPAVEVLLDLAEGDELLHLGELSRTAALVVVGVERVATDRPHRPSTLDRVLEQAGCPVLALNAHAARDVEVRRDVVAVGWSGGSDALRVLEVASAEAASRRARLTVLAVRSFDLREAAAPRGPEPTLVGAVAEVERRHPGLVIDVAHRTGGVFGELEDAARRADLLVVGAGRAERPGPDGPDAPDGPDDVVEVLTRVASCPVLVVPRHARRTAPAAQAHDDLREPASDPLGRL